MTIEKNNLNAAILSYIKENNLLEGFDKLEVFDTYTFIKKEKPFDTEHLDETIISYIYHQKRTYRFKIGNSECDIDIDCGNFSIPEQTYGNDVYKLEWDDKSEIINFLYTDTNKNSSIIVILATLLEIDIENVLYDYNITKKKREISYQIDKINSEIYKLKESKEELIKEFNKLSDEDIKKI